MAHYRRCPGAASPCPCAAAPGTGEDDVLAWSGDSHDSPRVFRVRLPDRRLEVAADLTHAAAHGRLLDRWFGLDPAGRILLFRPSGASEIFSTALR